MMVKIRLSLAPDDPKLCGHSSCGLGRGYTGAVTNAKDVWEPFSWTDKLVQKMFWITDISTHLLCCRVSLLTSRNPAASARLALEASGSGVLIGGVTCRRS